jgi:hypothetical protein
MSIVITLNQALKFFRRSSRSYARRKLSAAEKELKALRKYYAGKS